MKKTEAPNINLLEKTASAQILLYLFFNQQGVNRDTLLRNVKAAHDTIDSTINFLKINNLIAEEKTKSFPPERRFTLTQLGLKVAQPLSLIEDALEAAIGSASSSKEPNPE